MKVGNSTITLLPGTDQIGVKAMYFTGDNGDRRDRVAHLQILPPVTNEATRKPQSKKRIFVFRDRKHELGDAASQQKYRPRFLALA